MSVSVRLVGIVLLGACLFVNGFIGAVMFLGWLS